MKLSQFKILLQNNRDRGFRLVLPDQSAVPISFHITEVAWVRKTFIDCGGTMREVQSCQLQAWLGPDADHRIAAGKMANVLGRAAKFLPPGDLELEIEYETSVISQYLVAEAEVSDEFVTLQLATKTHGVSGAGTLPRSGAQKRLDGASDGAVERLRAIGLLLKAGLILASSWRGKRF